MNRQGGFTLIELMIAVGLTALLLSMAVPAMDMFVSNARQTGAVNDFVSSLHIARSTAITTNARVTVCPSAGGNNCEAVGWNQGWIVFTDRDGDQAVDVGETIVETGDAEPQLSIASAQFDDSLIYRPNGRVVGAGGGGNAGEFTICDDRGADKAKVMIIDLSGRPRLSEKLGDGSPPVCG